MAISFEILNGKQTGRTMEIPDDTDPSVVLRDFAHNDIRLKIDYENSTVGEWIRWDFAYLTYRIMEALLNRRCVKLQDRQWKRGWFTNARNMLGEILQSIDDTKMKPLIEADDDTGVIIGLSEDDDDMSAWSLLKIMSI